MKRTVIETDVLVVGGGIAGIMAAIAARREGAEVTLLSKSTAGRGGESVMAAGVYLGFEMEDDLEEWIRESMEVSDGMNDPLLVGKCILYSRHLRRLMDEWGVDWEKSGGKYVTKPGLGMTKMRNAMFNDGRQLMWVLRGKALELGARMLDRVMVVDLLTSDGQAPTGGGVVGVVGFHVRRPEIFIIKSKAVVLATGPWGINQFHPMDVTGDGEAMAYRVGARMRGIEQLCFSLAPRVALSLPGLHALTGHGGKFLNSLGERYMERYSPQLLERSPRAVLVQAAAKEIEAGRGPLYLDLTHLSAEDQARIARVVPHTVKALKSAGINLVTDLVEYMPTLYGNGPMGGVMIDENCATSISGLYCAGGATDRMYAGVPGLTGASATGFMAGRNAAVTAAGQSCQEPSGEQVEKILYSVVSRLDESGQAADPRSIYYQVQRVVLEKIGILKDPELLQEARQLLAGLAEKAAGVRAGDLHQLMNTLETINIAQISCLVAAASLERTESRYFNYRKDYPKRDDQNWSRWLICRQGPDGKPLFSTIPFRTLDEAREVLRAVREEVL